MNGSAGQLYGQCLDGLLTTVATLDEEQLHTKVPATPRWDVRTVVAHLAGVSSDQLSGRLDGAPGPGWTARHVAERSAIPVAHLLDELRSNQVRLSALADQQEPAAMAWDISVHLTDVHEALGLPGPEEELWLPVLDSAAPRRLDGLPVEVRAGSRSWGQGPQSVELSAYELFRALFSRRSLAQMRTWGTPTFDDEALAGICVFGPREDDQPVPSSVATST